MRAQIDFSRTPSFQKFLAGLFNLEMREPIGAFVQGVVVDLHPVWRGAWDFKATTGAEPDRAFPGYPPYDIFPGLISSAAGSPDTDWTCDAWDHFRQRAGKPEGGPLIAKICTRQMPPDGFERRTLQAYADRQPFFCVLEERPPARALAAVQGGGKIATGSASGTLGGFLQDQHGDVYGMTCAHVAMASHASFDLHDVGGATLAGAASIAHSTASSLIKLSAGQLCNRPTTTGQTPDVALLQLAAGHTGTSSIRAFGVVDEILTENDLGSGSAVELRGGQSGYHSAYIGGYSVVYNVLFEDGNEYCFDHMFEVITRSSSRFAGLIPPALTSKPVSGDSGAWVCASSRVKAGNYGFAGMLTAGDGSNAYVCFADAILDWAKVTHALDLSPL
jgi:hypothetical protein